MTNSPVVVRRAVRPEDLPPAFVNRPAAYLSSLFENGGPGTVVLLAQGSIWELEAILKIAVNDAELATEGYPTDPNLHAQVHSVGEGEATAIFFHNTSHVKLSHLTIDGRRPDKGWVDGGGPLIACGGREGKDPVVQYCVIRHPRGWSSLQVFDNCEGGRVIGNKIGPAGLPAPKGPWADGLSIACRNGLIANNEIVDATDGAIVLFCAPGTMCIGNTIIADKQNLLGGINMVDMGPYSCDYTDTRVFNNVIKSTGAHIKLGIGIGPLAWCPTWNENTFGGKVIDNTFGPGRFGYAIGMSGCRDFEVVGNRVTAGTTFTGDLSGMQEPLNAPPMAFLKASQPGLVENCVIQQDFIEGRAAFLIGVEDRPARKFRFQGSQLNLTSTDGPIVLDRARISLETTGELRVLCNATSRVLWTSGSAGSVIGARLSLEDNGHLTIREAGTGKLLWDPVQFLEGCFQVGNQAALTVSDESPYLSLWSECNSLVWASEYVFGKGSFELAPNQFICICPTRTRAQPPPIPPRIGAVLDNISHAVHHPPPMIPARPLPPPAYIFLDPVTSNLVIHRGPHPHQPHGHVLWASDLFGHLPKQIASRANPGCETRCAFQGGDGNLVIYANPHDHQPEERCAVWASGTCCEKLLITYEAEQGVQIHFLDPQGVILKSIP
ncbi:uncharacterized protein PGTG_18184 [Puccinia graminis f. sp. tritici CRL 75-36-700-3]|uniref:Uncharacterized protein n=1 Tax=Puccinia graminis f. sp. tritici (strain CRL 75-36-700-3 / race SCCL) TaxID=418459 RepID=E3L7Z4_PUCGT|nr:uncharacterized protein PGTG_18184 [Puccinia graminis f. sp. tritici CRL 75-36-700-3]EFP92669.2 hypothetical protein PGTG_18184 [Puccinia graminis f. sp. tritici CRL 75-36-700-3]